MSDFFDLKKLDIKEKIGEGSYAKVFKVLDKSNGEVYAAKISKIEFEDINKSDLLNLNREVNIMAQINHRSILKFVGYSPTNFKNKPKPVILLEYSANDTLKSIIDLERKSLSPKGWDNTKKLINIFGIASAMSYLHLNNIIHRDLKPANILEDDYLFPKIADFGLSKQMHTNESSMTDQSTTCFKGSLAYSAPECILKYEFTKASDVYSFAMIVYEIVTSEVIFPNFINYIQIANAAMNGIRPEFKYPIPDCYRDLITSCWGNDPNERPTFDQIVNMLKTNEDFIIEGVDKDEYLDYIELIENSEKSFNSFKKFKKVILSQNENVKVKEEAKVEEVETTTGSSQKVQDTKSQSQKMTQNNQNQKSSQKVQDTKSQPQKMTQNNQNQDPSQKVQDTKSQPQKMTQKDQIQNLSQKVQDTKSQPLTLIDKYKNSSSKELTIPSNESAFLLENNLINSTDFFNATKHFEKVTIESEYPSQKCDQLISAFPSIQQKMRTIGIQFIITDLNSVKNMLKLPFQFSVTFSPSIKIINQNCFTRNKQLVGVVIPSTINEIGVSSFSECSSLKHVTFETPSNLATIKGSAFSKCASLDEIEIPSSVTSICNFAFNECKLLKKVTIPTSVIELGKSLFSNCISLKSITIPSSVTTLPDGLLGNCTSLAEVNFDLPSSITKIERGVFTKCSSLKQITIPPSVTEIGYNSFSSCSSLVNVLLPSSLTKIDSNFMPICQSLVEITIPSSVVEIGAFAFDRCSSLKKVTFESPSSLISLGNGAFQRTLIEQVEIPSSVVKVGKDIFKDCKLLKKLSIPSALKASVPSLAIPKNINVDIKYI